MNKRGCSDFRLKFGLFIKIWMCEKFFTKFLYMVLYFSKSGIIVLKKEEGSFEDGTN